MPPSRKSTPTGATANGPDQPPAHLELDALDQALIEKLRHDGRAGNRALAAELNVNEVTVAARLRRMADANVMRVVALTDIRLFGYEEYVWAMIRVVGRPVNAVAAELARLPEVIGVTTSTGRFDIHVAILGRDRVHIGELFDSVLPRIKGIDYIHPTWVLEVLKNDSKWALFGVAPGVTLEAQPTDDVDDMDIEIIRLLQQNARRSNRQIAADLGVSEGTVRVRIKKMLADHIFRIQAVSDVAVSGAAAVGYVLVDVRPGKVDEVVRALARREDVSHISRVLDDFALLVILHEADRATFLDNVIGEIAQLPGVRRTETMEVVSSLKHTYAWTWMV